MAAMGIWRRSGMSISARLSHCVRAELRGGESGVRGPVGGFVDARLIRANDPNHTLGGEHHRADDKTGDRTTETPEEQT